MIKIRKLLLYWSVDFRSQIASGRKTAAGVVGDYQANLSYRVPNPHDVFPLLVAVFTSMKVATFGSENGLYESFLAFPWKYVETPVLLLVSHDEGKRGRHRRRVIAPRAVIAPAHKPSSQNAK